MRNGLGIETEFACTLAGSECKKIETDLARSHFHYMNASHVRLTILRIAKYLCALLFIATGLFFASIYSIDSFRPSKNRWSTESILQAFLFDYPTDKVVQPVKNEWALSLAKRVIATRSSEQYIVEISDMRGSDWLEIQTTGPAEEGTRGMSDAIFEAFVQSLQRSHERLAIRGSAVSPQPAPNGNPPVHLTNVTFASIARLIPPILLLASGIQQCFAYAKVDAQTKA